MTNFKCFVQAVFIFILIHSSSAFSGGGGISGGSNAARNFQEYNLCNFGEAGTSCMRIRIECSQLNGAGDQRPCGNENLFQTPQFLQRLNKMIQSDPLLDASQSGG